MTTATAEHGVVTEAGTIRFERLLPGPIERVWAYLTDSDKRRTWLAAGPMELRPGGALEMTWRNSELAGPGETTPERFVQYEGYSMQGRILEAEPPRLLVFTWPEEEGGESEVSFALAERGGKVLLTLTHRKLATRGLMVGVAGGWHSHLAVLEARLDGRDPPPFWPMVERVEQDYQERVPAE
jgi:uncharacterized protein YndB with AHSA1/START domain